MENEYYDLIKEVKIRMDEGMSFDEAKQTVIYLEDFSTLQKIVFDQRINRFASAFGISHKSVIDFLYSCKLGK